MIDSMQLGVIRFIDQNREHRVFAWGNYGVTVPDLWTTNGSIRLTAELIEQFVSADKAIWLPDTVCGDGTIEEQLQRGYAHFVKCPSIRTIMNIEPEESE